MITSTSNPQVKSLVQLQKKPKARREQGLYVVEGVRMFAEAPEELTDRIYAAESFLAQPQGKALLDGRRFEVLSDAVFAHVSDTKTPQGILCVMCMREYTLDAILTGQKDSRTVSEEAVSKKTAVGHKDSRSASDEAANGQKAIRSASDEAAAAPNSFPALKNGLWLVLESLQDPGNLGTIFRTAEGTGVAGLLMDDATADVYNPKTVRAAMGSLFRVPFVVTDDLPGALGQMKENGICIRAAALSGSVDYAQCDYTAATAFLIGNEGNGLSDTAIAAADSCVRIPMRGNLESLNASVAAGVLLYEADRQRRKKEDK